MTLTDNPLYDALSAAWDRGRDELRIAPSSNVILRLGETLKFCAGVQGGTDFFDLVKEGVSGHPAKQFADILIHAGDDAKSAVNTVFNQLSAQVEADKIDVSLQDMVVIAAYVSQKDDELLGRLLSAQAECQREVMFQNQYGGPAMTQIHEHQWLRLMNAGATHVGVSKDDNLTQAIFYKDGRTLEVGRFTAHSQSTDNESDFFKLAEVQHVMPKGVITPIPSRVFDTSLYRHIQLYLQSNDTPAGWAHTVTQEVDANNPKPPQVMAAAVAIYQFMREKIDQGETATALSVLGYIAHYPSPKLSDMLMRSVSATAQHRESDYTVTRGLHNIANDLATQMLNAKSVFSRRAEAVEQMSAVMENPEITTAQKIAIAAATFQFSSQDVAAWVAHDYDHKQTPASPENSRIHIRAGV